MKEYQYSSKMMGTELDVSIIAEEDPTQEYMKVEELFHSYEKKYSRFLEMSELSLLNKNKEISATKEWFEILEEAKRLYEYSDHIFNPLCSPSYFGYIKSFDDIRKNDVLKVSSDEANTNFSEIIIDQKKQIIRLQENQYLDFGGFLKGYVSDVASEMLSKYLGNIINFGGDISRGYDINGKEFIFSIAHPFEVEKDIGTLKLHNMSLATSSTLKRNWKIGSHSHNHIIDPRTFESTKSSIASISVVTGSGSYADALATTGFILGVEDGLKFFNERKIPVLYIDMNLKMFMNDPMAKIFNPLV